MTTARARRSLVKNGNQTTAIRVCARTAGGARFLSDAREDARCRQDSSTLPGRIAAPPADATRRDDHGLARQIDAQANPQRLKNATSLDATAPDDGLAILGFLRRPTVKTATEILREHGLNPPSDAPGRYYTICPKCSAARSKAHQKNKVLGITIDSEGVSWGCNHCGWTGGGYYNGKANGHAGDAAGIVATYDYTDENGELLFQVVRKEGKKFVQRRPNGKGGWIWNTKGVQKTIYRLPEIDEAIAGGHTVLVVEGEKDAELRMEAWVACHV